MQYVLLKPWDMNRLGVSQGMLHLCHQQATCIRDSLARHQVLFSKWFVSRGT